MPLTLLPIALLAIIIITCSGPTKPQTVAKAPLKEQSLFSAEDQTADSPIKLPDGALEILRRDEQVLRFLAAEDKSPQDLTTELFLASEIHLDGHEETDLIALGEGRLRGANVVTFWVFRKLPNGYRLVLKTTAAGLRVERTKSKGFRNISTASPIAGSSVETFYTFDGKEYKQFRTRSEPIK